MIGCYCIGLFPRPEKMIEATRAYERKKITKEELEKEAKKATLKILKAQLEADLSYISDGMLKWLDPLRPFTEGLNGVKVGSLARWFDNNTFYRKPIIIEEIWRKKNIIEEFTYINHFSLNLPWKADLPAPFTFVQLSKNEYYKDKTELMFKYAKILRKEIEDLIKLGCEYIQFNDPALVYTPFLPSKEELGFIKDALKSAIKGVPVKTCLQTFFGDFSRIMPEAMEFPIDFLGIDLYSTDYIELKKYKIEKGISLGLVDSRSSLIEEPQQLVTRAMEILKLIHESTDSKIYICPNCDLEFLPWNRAKEKIKVVGTVTKLLRKEIIE